MKDTLKPEIREDMIKGLSNVQLILNDYRNVVDDEELLLTETDVIKSVAQLKDISEQVKSLIDVVLNTSFATECVLCKEVIANNSDTIKDADNNPYCAPCADKQFIKTD